MISARSLQVAPCLGIAAWGSLTEETRQTLRDSLILGRSAAKMPAKIFRDADSDGAGSFGERRDGSFRREHSSFYREHSSAEASLSTQSR